MSDRESYLIELSERIVPVLWESPDDLTAPERTFAAIWQLEAEVNNGGFRQYYFNSAGDLAREAPEALEAIGARRTAEIVRAANALFPAGPPNDVEARETALEALPDDAFAELDDRFLAYEEDLSSLLHTYVQANRAGMRGA